MPVQEKTRPTNRSGQKSNKENAPHLLLGELHHACVKILGVSPTKKQSKQMAQMIVGALTTELAAKHLSKQKKHVPSGQSADAIALKYLGIPAGANALRQYRKAAKLNQTELANSCGIEQGAISAMERGKESIGVKRAKNLANVLKIDFRLLL
jgi:DNA-binding XRE family transcriptional regulator